MEFAERELLVARIISGCVRIRLRDKKGKEDFFLLKNPDRYQRYVAQEIYQEALRDAQLNGLFEEDELLLYLAEEGLWSDEEETKLKELEKNVDELKVKLYELQFKTNEKKLTRKLLDITREEISTLWERRHKFDTHTCVGTASLARLRYLIAASLAYPNGQSVFHGEADFWSGDSTFGEILDEYTRTRLTEPQVRELARTEPWRSYWAARKEEGSLFGLPAVDLTEEQKGLVTWSIIYENAPQHPEAPSAEVLEDDDIFDGWLIIQRRKREQEMKKGADALITNEKIRNSEEIFIMADTIEDARKIDELNALGARVLKQKRMNLIKKRGSVDETDMPDSQLKIQQAINRARGR